MDNKDKRNENSNKSGIEYGAMALLSVLAVPVILLAGFLLDDVTCSQCHENIHIDG
ncbi:hypothetical protein [Butyrivibrio sp. AE3004]|uniref:hypothetical protein n=1 Tax=Butyrivibrio sp. AE3004 TaxID=1506994 RepID=UPI000ADD8522|nr:hypothetical protein [Butyrivibrio sp. AE3004]